MNKTIWNKIKISKKFDLRLNEIFTDLCFISVTFRVKNGKFVETIMRNCWKNAGAPSTVVSLCSNFTVQAGSWDKFLGLSCENMLPCPHFSCTLKKLGRKFSTRITRRWETFQHLPQEHRRKSSEVRSHFNFGTMQD